MDDRIQDRSDDRQWVLALQDALSGSFSDQHQGMTNPRTWFSKALGDGLGEAIARHLYDGIRARDDGEDLRMWREALLTATHGFVLRVALDLPEGQRDVHLVFDQGSTRVWVLDERPSSVSLAETIPGGLAQNSQVTGETPTLGLSESSDCLLLEDVSPLDVPALSGATQPQAQITISGLPECQQEEERNPPPEPDPEHQQFTEELDSLGGRIRSLEANIQKLPESLSKVVQLDEQQSSLTAGLRELESSLSEGLREQQLFVEAALGTARTRMHELEEVAADLQNRLEALGKQRSAPEMTLDMESPATRQVLASAMVQLLNTALEESQRKTLASLRLSTEKVLGLESCLTGEPREWFRSKWQEWWTQISNHLASLTQAGQDVASLLRALSEIGRMGASPAALLKEMPPDQVLLVVANELVARSQVDTVAWTNLVDMAGEYRIQIMVPVKGERFNESTDFAGTNDFVPMPFEPGRIVKVLKPGMKVGERVKVKAHVQVSRTEF